MAEPKSKFEIYLDKCMAQAEQLNLEVSRELMHKVVLSLGPTIYNSDSSMVATSDPKEMAYVKESFLKGKLEMTDEGEMDRVLLKVKEEMKTARSKYRAVFYIRILILLKLGNKY